MSIQWPMWISFPKLPLKYQKLTNKVVEQVDPILAVHDGFGYDSLLHLCVEVDPTQGWIFTVLSYSASGGSATIPVQYENLELSCSNCGNHNHYAAQCFKARCANCPQVQGGSTEPQGQMHQQPQAQDALGTFYAVPPSPQRRRPHRRNRRMPTFFTINPPVGTPAAPILLTLITTSNPPVSPPVLSSISTQGQHHHWPLRSPHIRLATSNQTQPAKGSSVASNHCDNSNTSADSTTRRAPARPIRGECSKCTIVIYTRAELGSY